MASERRSPRFFYGWVILVIAAILPIFSYGLRTYSWGNFLPYFQREFGWSRAELSGVYTAATWVIGFSAPVIGRIVDRFGGRLIVAGGAILVGVCLTATGYLVSELWHLYLLYGVLAALGLTCFSYYGVMPTVARWWIRRRGLGMGATTVGGGLGGTVFAPLSAFLLSVYGWRTSYLMLGVLAVVVLVPLALFAWKRDPADLGQYPDGIAPDAAPTASAPSRAAAPPAEVSFTLGQALRTGAIWAIIAAYFFNGVTVGAVAVHQTPALIDMGIDPVAAGAILGLMTAVGLPGRLLWGWAGDRFNPIWLTFFCFCGMALAMVIFANAKDINWIWPYVVIYGACQAGPPPLRAVLAGKFYGRESFGVIFGIISLPMMLASGLGPLVAGFVYDVTQSYVGAFYGLAVGLVLSASIIHLAHPPKPPAPRTAS